MTQTAKEYASALFELAAETGAEEEISSSLEYMLGIFRQNPKYTGLLASPAIPQAERSAALAQAFGGRVCEYVLGFARLMCERGHIREFEESAAEFERLCRKSRGIVTARIVSAVPLTVSEKARLIQKLGSVSGRIVIPEYSTDESLIGGVTVYMDGTVMDGSIKRRLTDAKEVLEK